MTTLADDPPARRFNSTQEAELLEALKENDQHSLCLPVVDVRELTLNRSARTNGNDRRLTTWALYQVCQAACPGLYKFLYELSGDQRDDTWPRSDYSFDDALAAYNQVVRRRFESRLRGRQMLLNVKTGLVEGVVGPKYRWLRNTDLAAMSKELLAGCEKPHSFYEGVLNGRWLMLRYYRPATFLTVASPTHVKDRFLSGYHFSNNEVGEASVRAGVFLVRDVGRTVSFLPSTVGRATHTGMSFEQRLKRLLDGCVGRLGDAEWYAHQLSAMQHTSLRLGQKGKAEDARREDIAHALVRRGLTRGVARRVVGSVIRQGSYDEKPMPVTHLAEAELPSRTAYDLFNALGREAKGMAISQRERVEHVAHLLLAGKFTVT